MRATLASLAFLLPAVAFAAPDISILAIEVPSAAITGEYVTYRITFTNLGDAAASNYPLQFHISPAAQVTTFNPRLATMTGPSISPGQVSTFEYRVQLPPASSTQTYKSGLPYRYTLGVIADPLNTIGEANATLGNNLRFNGQTYISAPAADFVALGVEWGTIAAAGTVVPVTFEVANTGVLNAETLVSFYVSTNERVTTNDLQTGQIRVALSAGGHIRQTAWIRLPASLPPGAYYLGMMLNSDGGVTELTNENNTAVSTVANVSAASLYIQTSAVADALLGAPYVQSLIASGGTSDYHWRLVSGSLPVGITLSDAGLFSGTTQSVGVFSPTVEVQSGQGVAQATFILRAYGTTGSLEIATRDLPPALVGADYEIQLAGLGGTPPYAWQLQSGALPAGLKLTADGRVSGKAATPSGGSFTVAVVDSTGLSATRLLALRAVSQNDLAIVQSSIDDAAAGRDFSFYLRAMGGSAPYHWTLAGGGLPDGLAVSQQDDAFVISGKPADAGIFTFTVRVEDVSGQSDRSQFVMLVNPGQLQIVTTSLPDAQRGQPYDVTLTASTENVEWTLESGELPTGLSLDAQGHLRGTVSSSASARIYTLLVTASDSSGAIGRMGLSLLVQAAASSADSESGCHQSPLSAIALVVAAFGLLSRRAPRKLSILMGALLVSTSALAATSPYAVVSEAVAYEPLVSGTPLTFTSTDNGFTAIPLPATTPAFSVPFFDQQITTFTVGVDGYLVLGTTTAMNSTPSRVKFPSNATSTPKNIIAPYWTNLYLQSSATNSNVRWTLSGNAPNRVLIVEWNGVVTSLYSSYSPATISFQAQIAESGEIAFVYGDKSGAGYAYDTINAGMQNQDGTIGYNASFCANSCKHADWTVGRRVRFTRLANLEGAAVVGPAVTYTEVDAGFSAKINNTGAVNATGVTGEVYLSQVASPSDSMVHVWTLPPADIAAGASKVYLSNSVHVPMSVPPGIYYPVLKVDPAATVPQSGPIERVVVGAPVKIGIPGPDLQVTSVTSTTNRAAVGDSVPVSLTLANKGNLPASAHWRVVLSFSEALSVSDRVMKEASVPLTPGQQEVVQTSFTVPPDIRPGTYYLGVVVTVDESEGQSEINAFNNTARASSPLTVSAPLAIVTESLPEAMIGGQYTFRLLWTGGDGFALWSLPNGVKLPPGLTLSPTGDISGVPSQVGTTTFRINCTSNQTQTVSTELTLKVTESGLPLSFPTSQLPTAIFELDYGANLMATGGTPPYAFTLRSTETGSVLPLGLAIDSIGVITGVPRQTGSFPLTIDVTDRSGTRLTRELVLNVVASARAYVDLQELPDAVLGKQYLGHITATGGAPPYKWQALTVRRMGDATGPSTDMDGVPGLKLGETGDLTGAPTLLGMYELAVRLKDSTGASAYGVVILTVRADSGLAILTRQLPAAEVGKPYNQSLVVAGGDGQLRFTLDSELQPLPEGLTLETDGRITGTPTRVVRQTFIVRVTDGSGRTDVRALTIDVRAAPAKDEGCSAAGGASLLGLMVLVFALRRPRGWKQGALVAVMLSTSLSLTACSSKESTAQPCDGVQCQPGEVCDASDGICKCGGISGRACSEFEQCNASTLSCELLDRCFLVSCVREMVCDPADGLCKCGAEQCGPGTVCSPQDRTCITRSPCEGVACAAGLSCDEDEGRCKCGGTGGALCDVGQRCESGACVADLCASVTCTGGTVCNPGDGKCHCGETSGDVCLYGQTCVPVQKKCQTSTLCAGVRCPGGASCDPADGQCRCGGAGGPVCGPNQSCDIAQQRCVGGDQCFNKTCPANTVCDPEDGSCRCGSAGTVCTAQQVCLGDTDASRVCRTSCDPVNLTPCENTESCGYDITTKLSLCAYPGARAEGAACDVNTQCGRGLGCVALSGTIDKACRAYCARPDGACEDPTRSCRTFAGAPATLGACMP
jgi:hypothetical protein